VSAESKSFREQRAKKKKKLKTSETFFLSILTEQSSEAESGGGGRGGYFPDSSNLKEKMNTQDSATYLLPFLPPSESLSQKLVERRREVQEYDKVLQWSTDLHKRDDIFMHFFPMDQVKQKPFSILSWSSIPNEELYVIVLFYQTVCRVFAKKSLSDLLLVHSQGCEWRPSAPIVRNLLVPVECLAEISATLLERNINTLYRELMNDDIPYNFVIFVLYGSHVPSGLGVNIEALPQKIPLLDIEAVCSQLVELAEKKTFRPSSQIWRSVLWSMRQSDSELENPGVRYTKRAKKILDKRRQDVADRCKVFEEKCIVQEDKLNVFVTRYKTLEEKYKNLQNECDVLKQKASEKDMSSRSIYSKGTRHKKTKTIKGSSKTKRTINDTKELPDMLSFTLQCMKKENRFQIPPVNTELAAQSKKRNALSSLPGATQHQVLEKFEFDIQQDTCLDQKPKVPYFLQLSTKELLLLSPEKEPPIVKRWNPLFAFMQGFQDVQRDLKLLLQKQNIFEEKEKRFAEKEERWEEKEENWEEKEKRWEEKEKAWHRREEKLNTQLDQLQEEAKRNVSLFLQNSHTAKKNPVEKKKSMVNSGNPKTSTKNKHKKQKMTLQKTEENGEHNSEKSCRKIPLVIIEKIKSRFKIFPYRGGASFRVRPEKGCLLRYNTSERKESKVFERREFQLTKENPEQFLEEFKEQLLVSLPDLN